MTGQSWKKARLSLAVVNNKLVTIVDKTFTESAIGRVTNGGAENCLHFFKREGE